MKVNFVTTNLTQKMGKAISPTTSETQPQTPTTQTPIISASRCAASFGQASVSLGKHFPKKLTPGSRIDGKVTEDGFSGTVITPNGSIIILKDGELAAAGAKKYKKTGTSSIIETRSALNERLLHSCEINHEEGTVDRRNYDIMGTATGRTTVHSDGTKEDYNYSPYGRAVAVTRSFPDGSQTTEALAS